MLESPMPPIEAVTGLSFLQIAWGGGRGVCDAGEELRSSPQGGEIWNPRRHRAGEKSLG